MTSIAPAVRLRFWLWCLAVAALAAWFLVAVRPQLRIETDILALLPQDERDPAVEDALRALSESQGRHLVFLAGAEDFAAARAGANALAATLRADPAFARVDLDVSAAQLEDLAAFYAPYRDGLLAPRTRALLARGDRDALLMDARRAVYTPAALLRRTQVADDPLHLFGAFLAGLAPATTLDLRDGVLALDANGQSHVLVAATLALSPFSTQMQEAADATIARARAAAAAAGAERVLGSGVVLHAAAAGHQAKREMTLIGNVSLAGVIVLMLAVFGSVRLLVLAGVVVATAALAGLLACHAAFGGMHVLTLVFGCSLIGVAVDYAIHYYGDQFHEPGVWQPARALARVGPGLGLGMLTTCLCYLALLFAPFPGLRQMALFTAVGLASAWVTVMCVFPVLARPTRTRHAQRTRAAAQALELASRQLRSRSARIAIAAVVLIALAGLARIHFEDDIRLLQASPAALLAEERELGALLGAPAERQLFVVRADSGELLLQKLEALAERLDPALASGEIAGYQSLAQQLPSLQRQQQQRALLAREVYAPAGVLPAFMAELGFDAVAIEARLQAFAQATPRPLGLADWLAAPAARPQHLLWLGLIDGQASAAVTLTGLREGSTLAARVAGLPGVTWIDPVAQTSATMARYRRTALLLIAAAYVLGAGLLALRFGLAGGALVVAVPVLAGLATLGLLSWAGVAVNLFSVIGILLVMGVGVDYPVLLREAGAERVPAVFATVLSVLTNLLGFGMLAASSTPFIRTIGMTMSIGVVLAIALALALNPATTKDARA